MLWPERSRGFFTVPGADLRSVDVASGECDRVDRGIDSAFGGESRRMFSGWSVATSSMLGASPRWPRFWLSRGARAAVATSRCCMGHAPACGQEVRPPERRLLPRMPSLALDLRHEDLVAQEVQIVLYARKEPGTSRPGRTDSVDQANPPPARVLESSPSQNDHQSEPASTQSNRAALRFIPADDALRSSVRAAIASRSRKGSRARKNRRAASVDL